MADFDLPRRKLELAPAAVQPAAVETVPAVQDHAGFAWGGGSAGPLAGATDDRARGAIWWNEPDTRREIDSYSRIEVMRRMRWAYVNLGLIRACVDGVNRLIFGGGGLMLKALTEDREWNKKREALWKDKMRSRLAVDVAGKRNLTGAMRLLARRADIDGDAAWVLSKSPRGSARLAFYHGHQFGEDPEDPDDPESRWFDGVLTNRQGRVMRYRLLRGDDKGHVDLKGNDVLLYFREESGGACRGISPLHHAINHTLDRTEIIAYTKAGIKGANRFAYYTKLAANAPPVSDMGAALMGRVKESGEPITVDWKTLFGQGGAVPNLPPGQELAMLADSRPHQNAMEFDDRLVREIAVGYGVAPELIWNVVALGGANARLVLKLMEPFVAGEQQRMVDCILTRWYVYDTALDIQAGRLAAPSDPEWYKHGWLPPERLSVDMGRDGKLKVELMAQRLMTRRSWFAGQQLDWRDEIDQTVEERSYEAIRVREAMEANNLTRAELITAGGQGPEVGEFAEAAMSKPPEAEV